MGDNITKTFLNQQAGQMNLNDAVGQQLLSKLNHRIKQ